MMVRYPDEVDELHALFASDRDFALAINALMQRVGAKTSLKPDSIEARLYTVENLVVDTWMRLDALFDALPVGLGGKK